MLLQTTQSLQLKKINDAYFISYYCDTILIPFSKSLHMNKNTVRIPPQDPLWLLLKLLNPFAS